MTGLRQQQKQARREAIHRAAAHLFATRGYASTTVEDIANEAAVSVPTLYAYVPSKAALMVSLYAHDRALVDARKQAIIDNTGDDPEAAITQLLVAEMKDGQDFLGHDVWREIVATTIRRRADYQSELDELNRVAFDEPVTRLLRTLQQRGLISASVDVEGVVAVLSDLVMAVFHQELAHDREWDWVEQRLRRHVATITAGLRPVRREPSPGTAGAARPAQSASGRPV